MEQRNTTISIPKVQGYESSKNAIKPNVETDETIINNGFFPNVTLLEVRNAMRIDGTVINERLKTAAIEAMTTVNADLKSYRLNAQKEGKADLVSCDDEFINGESVLVYKYKRAVFCLAVANLNERYRSFDSTKEGHNKSDELGTTADDLKRDYHFAVRDILGHNRMISELI
ncbi:head protein [Mannheimia granulomatis]|uniref:Head protein n=1 Tax=Mannheimia granulomatis TaxID=85402 RepID=A0A011MGP6_9PAST|nr:head completion/stabilization protein [Mannheimia granulomatis]EXI61681.1 head protein [Mannheimia granulomatis]RGE48264.1 head protein [Mannheimia granulomatis]